MLNLLLTFRYLLISLLLFSCHQVSPPRPAASQIKIVGGEAVEADSPAWRSTVSLSKLGKDGFNSFCSGTLIAPDLVLTAAHCLEGIKSNKQFIVLFGKSEKDPEAISRAVTNFQSFRPQDGARYFPNFDIAWVKLEATAPAGYEPAEILRSADQLNPLIGVEDAILLAGFGRTKTECTTAEIGCSGTRLQVRTHLRRFINTAHFWQVLVLGPKPMHGTCNGDSGGSMFAQIGGRWYVVGDLNGKNLSLNSSAVWNSEKICESGESIYNFAGAYVDWIEQSSGVRLAFDSQKNPPGLGLAPIDSADVLGAEPKLATMLRYNNPDDPLWITSEILIENFGEESKRNIPELNYVVTDPDRAAAAMELWESFAYTGVGFDLASFALKDRQLSDLRPIAQLKNLKKLELTANRILDISLLAKLESLEELTLSNNYDFQTKKNLPYDLSILRYLPKLRVLNLMGNSGNLDVSGIPWESLGQLEVLNLAENSNTIDWSSIPFESLSKLRRLVIADSGVTDISFLVRAPNLESIDMRNNSIRDISVLSQLPSLQDLDLTQNLIEDFSSLSSLTELKQLRALANPQKIKACPEGAHCLFNPDPLPSFADYCKFSQNLSAADRPLWPANKTVILLLRAVGQSDVNQANCETASEALHLKKKLEFSGLKAAPWISDLSPLMPLTQLEELKLDHQSFQDLSPLGTLSQLRSLDLSSNRLTSLQGLEGLPNLKRLVVDQNKLSDISLLAAIPGLNLSALNNPNLPKICPIPEGTCVFD